VSTRTVIESIRVDGTGFLKPFQIDLSPGLNCIIGARGTGKTSLIELIRFAAGREDDTDAAESIVSRLVPAALGEGGHIELRIRTPLGKALVVRREVSGPWSALDADTGEPAGIQWPALGVYDLAIFSQNQLEEIATSPSGRLATLDSFCGSDLERINADVRDVQQRLDVNATQQIQLANEIEGLRSQSESLPKLQTELDIVTQQYNKALVDLQGQEPVKKRVKELSEIRQAISQEDQLVSVMLSEAEAALLEPFPGRTLGERLRQSLQEDVISALPDRDALRALRTEISHSSRRYADLRNAMGTALTEVRDAVFMAHTDVAAKLSGINREYQELSRALGAVSQAWKEASARRDSLLSQARTLQSAAVGIEQRQAQLSAVRQQRVELLNRLNALFEERFGIRQGSAAQLNAAIGGTVVVHVIQGGSGDRYEQFLLQAFKGSAMWYSRLVASIIAKVPPGRLAEMARAGQSAQLSGATGIDEDRARRALAILADGKLPFNLEALDVDDAVVFALNVGNDEYRESDSLSQGQKCTTVLSLMLVDDNDPLVIDQPEDNLDNAYVVDTVVDVVARQRENRQFIFVTHNPNLPVLAGADLVIAMQAIDGKGSPIVIGQWNDSLVMDQIISIMEGGRQAFARRESAYRSREWRTAAG
jgi:ABC-type lipoprotein export system ATPase subunit